jgi:hypothetical protein
MSGFDWDDDFDDLVNGKGPVKPAVQYSPPPDEVAPMSAAAGSLRALVARWIAPAFVVLALAAGVSFPEKFGLGGKTLQTASLFAPLSLQTEQPTAEIALLAYSAAQHRNFVTGLKLFSDADLLSYAAVTQVDLGRASPVLAPLLQDALTLTRQEIGRRNLTPPSPAHSVQDVLIQTPLQG